MGLILVSISSFIWFASTPLPFGGLNVYFSSLMVLSSTIGISITFFRNFPKDIFFFLKSKIKTNFGIIVLICIGFTLWSSIVHFVTGFHLTSQDNIPILILIGKMLMGIGVMSSVYFTVNSFENIKIITRTIVFATFVSLLFGFLVFFFENPFFDYWIKISNPPMYSAANVLRGRISGLSLIPTDLAYYLCLAIPFLIYDFCHFIKKDEKSFSKLAISIIFLGIFFFGALANQGRAMILGCILGCIFSMRSMLLKILTVFSKVGPFIILLVGIAFIASLSSCRAKIKRKHLPFENTIPGLPCKSNIELGVLKDSFKIRNWSANLITLS